VVAVLHKSKLLDPEIKHCSLVSLMKEDTRCTQGTALFYDVSQNSWPIATWVIADEMVSNGHGRWVPLQESELDHETLRSRAAIFIKQADVHLIRDGLEQTTITKDRIMQVGIVNSSFDMPDYNFYDFVTGRRDDCWPGYECIKGTEWAPFCFSGNLLCGSLFTGETPTVHPDYETDEVLEAYRPRKFLKAFGYSLKDEYDPLYSDNLFTYHEDFHSFDGMQFDSSPADGLAPASNPGGLPSIEDDDELRGDSRKFKKQRRIMVSLCQFPPSYLLLPSPPPPQKKELHSYILQDDSEDEDVVCSQS
jgi:hypothetical protein